jgi:phage gp29-like protein
MAKKIAKYFVETEYLLNKLKWRPSEWFLKTKENDIKLTRIYEQKSLVIQ